jgi:ornithine--oxo-acid transaminase
MNHFIQLDKQYSANYLKTIPLVISKGEGCYLWDSEGKQYLDLMSAISVTNFGHSHPRLINKLQQQANQLNALSRLFHSEQLGPFLEKLCQLTGLEQAIPMNTGAEAIETAIKVARKWAYCKKGVPDNQAEIIVCTGNFHGRTVATVSCSSTDQYKKQFGPLMPGFKLIPYNNVEQLKSAITANTAAFIVEPIQGEAGVQVPTPGYLEACGAICKQRHVLFICDEIQTGMGRTGQFLAHQHEQIKPDGVTLGKALGGGILPVSAFVASKEVMEVLAPGDHGSTFGGNPLASAIAYEALCLLQDEDLIKASASLGQYFLKELRSIDSPYIQEVRGRGLLIGVEIAANSVVTAEKIQQRLQDNGLLCIVSHGKVLRLAPALTISKEQLNIAIDKIKNIFEMITAEAAVT